VISPGQHRVLGHATDQDLPPVVDALLQAAAEGPVLPHLAGASRGLVEQVEQDGGLGRRSEQRAEQAAPGVEQVVGVDQHQVLIGHVAQGLRAVVEVEHVQVGLAPGRPAGLVGVEDLPAQVRAGGLGRGHDQTGGGGQAAAGGPDLLGAGEGVVGGELVDARDGGLDQGVVGRAGERVQVAQGRGPALLDQRARGQDRPGPLEHVTPVAGLVAQLQLAVVGARVLPAPGGPAHEASASSSSLKVSASRSTSARSL
jgi:hypothetical protein